MSYEKITTDPNYSRIKVIQLFATPAPQRPIGGKSFNRYTLF